MQFDVIICELFYNRIRLNIGPKSIVMDPVNDLRESDFTIIFKIINFIL